MASWPAVGSRVAIRLAAGEAVEGYLYAVDEASGMAVVTAPNVPRGYGEMALPLRPTIEHRVSLVSLASVVSVAAAEPSGEEGAQAALLGDDLVPLVRSVRPERLARAEMRALEKRKAQFGSRAPPGATSQALAIFAALSKTYVCVPLLPSRTHVFV